MHSWLNFISFYRAFFSSNEAATPKKRYQLHDDVRFVFALRHSISLAVPTKVQEVDFWAQFRSGLQVSWSDFEAAFTHQLSKESLTEAQVEIVTHVLGMPPANTSPSFFIYPNFDF